MSNVSNAISVRMHPREKQIFKHTENDISKTKANINAKDVDS